MSDEDLAEKYADTVKCEWENDTYWVDCRDEVTDAFIAGRQSKEKELKAQIEKMKSLLKEVYEEYGFGELVKIRNNLPLEIQEIIGE